MTLIALLALLLSAPAHATEYSGSDPQATETSLEQNGGGEFHVSTFYSSTSPLIVSQQVPTTIADDGYATGFNNGNISGLGNLWQIGENSAYNTNFIARNMSLTNNVVNGVRPPYETAIFITQSAAPYFEDMNVDGFYNVTWLTGVWAAKFHHVRMTNGAWGISLDPATPANNVTLNMCEGYSMTGAIVALYHGSNGLYIQNGDYEGDGAIVANLSTDPLANLVIDRNDIEGLKSGLIYNPYNAPITSLIVTDNTFGNAGTITIAGVTGGKMEGNQFYNTNVVVTQSQNTNFSFSCDKNVFTGTSTCTVN